ncbi:hypothetical protein JZ751_017572 [Albula glossodonta]|uniref:Uncharacterized protein n=1 Tax=Albula glossodonta TaxID=121402 RepID=A0A8T2PLK5_9TELE|nr:hypothetical protein JZ751_017572 [Albula glossodonta]
MRKLQRQIRLNKRGQSSLGNRKTLRLINLRTWHSPAVATTGQDDLLASLLQGLDSLVVSGLPQVVAVHREDGVAYVQRLCLVGRQPFENLGDENGHLVLFAPCKKETTVILDSNSTSSVYTKRISILFQRIPQKKNIFLFKHQRRGEQMRHVDKDFRRLDAADKNPPAPPRPNLSSSWVCPLSGS